MTELKPCPFCGGEAELYNDEGLWKVQCEDCEASTGQYYMPENAIAAWNTRHTDDDLK